MNRLFIFVAALLMGMLVVAPPASADPKEKVGVCHRTASETNPYVLIEVPADEANGHITGESKQHNHSVTWPEATVWNGVQYQAGDERLDYYASEQDVLDKDCPNRTPEPPECPDGDFNGDEPGCGEPPCDSDCEPPVTEYEPAPPTFLDNCGTENDEVQYIISDHPWVDYVETWNGLTVVVDAVDADANDLFVPLEGATLSWTFTFTDEECPTEPPAECPETDLPTFDRPIPDDDCTVTNPPPIHEVPEGHEPPTEHRKPGEPGVPTVVDAGLVSATPQIVPSDGFLAVAWILVGLGWIALIAGWVLWYRARQAARQ